MNYTKLVLKVIAVCALFVSITYASDSLQKANTYFEKAEYSKAILLYQQQLAKTPGDV